MRGCRVASMPLQLPGTSIVQTPESHWLWMQISETCCRTSSPSDTLLHLPGSCTKLRNMSISGLALVPWCQQTTAIPLPSGVIPAAKVESSRQQRGPSWSHGHAHGDRRAERSTNEAEALLDNMRLLYAGSAGSAGQAPVGFGHIHPMIAQSQATRTIHISCAFLLPIGCRCNNTILHIEAE